MKRLLRLLGLGKKSSSECSEASGHDCNEIASKLEELIDGEVDKATEQKLIEEINRCQHCLDHYDVDKAYKAFLHNKIKRKCCTEKLRAEILEKISAAES